MSAEVMEQKLADLQRRVEVLESKTDDSPQTKAWRELLGWEKDDSAFREAVRLGAEWRAHANAEGK